MPVTCRLVRNILQSLNRLSIYWIHEDNGSGQNTKLHILILNQYQNLLPDVVSHISFISVNLVGNLNETYPEKCQKSNLPVSQYHCIVVLQVPENLHPNFLWFLDSSFIDQEIQNKNPVFEFVKSSSIRIFDALTCDP